MKKMTTHDAEVCCRKAQQCAQIFAGVASGDYSEQWIERNLEAADLLLFEIIDVVADILGVEEEEAKQRG